MAVTLQVDNERVTVSEASITCSCASGVHCQHVESVLCGDSLAVKSGSLSQALKLIDPNQRLEALTRRLDGEKDPIKRQSIEAAIAHLLSDLGK